MKTIYVETHKVVSSNSKGESVYENMTQKLGEYDAFGNFLRFAKAGNYVSAKITGVYVQEKDKEPILVTDEETLAPYVLMLENSLKEVEKPKTQAELVAINKALEDRLLRLEEVLLSKELDPLEDLKQEAKDLGIVLKGKQTAESIQSKIDKVLSE